MIFVGIPADSRMIGPHPFQAVGEKYIRAILDGSGAQPLLIPSVAPGLDLDALLEQLDGLFLPGSPSNIEPHHYSDEPSYAGNLHDPTRDLTTQPHPESDCQTRSRAGGLPRFPGSERGHGRHPAPESA